MSVACFLIPQLPLQAALRAHPDDDTAQKAVALMQTTRGRRTVHSCNTIARRSGIRAGMDRSTARGLCNDLLLVDACDTQTQQALDALADVLGQFSPVVSLFPPDAIVVDLTGIRPESVSLDALSKAALSIGIQAHVALGHSPFAARALATVHAQSPLHRPNKEQQLLANLHLSSIQLPPDTLKALAVIGIHTLDAFLSLPSAAVARRFGAVAHRRWKEAKGMRVVALPPYRPQSPVSETRTVDDPIERMDLLSFHLKTLVDRVLQRVRGRNRGIEELTVTLIPVRNDPNHVYRTVLDLGRPQTDATLLLQLLRERLGHNPPQAPIEQIRITVSRDAPLNHQQLTLFGDPAAPEPIELTAVRLVGLLHGEERLVTALRDDYRPEQAYERVPFNAQAQDSSTFSLSAERPVRLLPIPQALSQWNAERLEPLWPALSGPERLQGGWWDGRPAARDYWVVAEPTGKRSWVYRDHRTGGWYLHGMFD